MSVINDLENIIEELEQSTGRKSKSLLSEYKNALAILKDEKRVTSCTLKHVINDLKIAMEFDESKVKEYSEAIEKLQYASI